MKILRSVLIAAFCLLNQVFGRSDLDAHTSNANESDPSQPRLSIKRALLDEGYSLNYLNSISDGIVQIERHSDERDLFVRRICNIIERLYSDGQYTCECSMKPLAPQVSYTCERYTPLQSGRASYGVRYQGSFIFRYLALALSTPASVCLTEMTYSSLALNGGRGGLLPFGDFCIESQLEIDVDPLQGQVSVSVDDCNVQLGDNLGTCTFCGACPTGPGFYIDCSDIWPIPFCVPNDIPLIGGRTSSSEDLGTETATQNVGERFLEEDTGNGTISDGGGGSFPKGLVGGIRLPDPEKIFKALDLARLLQQKIQQILAEQNSQQEPDEPSDGSSSGQQTGTVQDTTGPWWQPWADTNEPAETGEEPVQTDDDQIQTDDGPIQTDDDQNQTDDDQNQTDDDQVETDDDKMPDTLPSQGATTQQMGPIEGPTDSWQPWAAPDDTPIETDDDSMQPVTDDEEPIETDDDSMQPITDDEASADDDYTPAATDDDEQVITDDYAVNYMEEPMSTEQDSDHGSKNGNEKGSDKGNEKGANKEKKTKSPKGSTGEERESTKGMEKESTVKSQKDGKENKKTSSPGNDKVRGEGSSMRIQNMDGPSNEQMNDDDSSTQALETTEGTESNHDSNNKSKKDDKGEKNGSTNNDKKKEDDKEQKPQHDEGSLEEPEEEPSGGRWGRNSDRDSGPWFKGLLRKSG